MDIALRQDFDPDVDFYYEAQFEVYHEPYLLWNRQIWEAVAAACDVYRIEAEGEYAGDIILENRGKGTAYIVDFSILPDYQRRGVGTEVLNRIENRSPRLLAVTRKETLPFFLKSGFVLKRRIRDYYDRRVDGYYIECKVRLQKR